MNVLGKSPKFMVGTKCKQMLQCDRSILGLSQSETHISDCLILHKRKRKPYPRPHIRTIYLTPNEMGHSTSHSRETGCCTS